MKKLVLMAVAALVMAISPNVFAAGTLSDAQVQNFIGTMKGVQKMGRHMKAEGKNDVVSDQVRHAMATKSEFTPFSTSVETLKAQLPDQYKELTKIVTEQSFSSAEDWGKTGDQVIAAYISEKMLSSSAQTPEQIKAQMDPKMLEQMPPNLRAQMEQTFAMMNKVLEVPEADRAVVRPYMDQIDQDFDKSS